MNCDKGRHFFRWAGIIENEPGLWVVRDAQQDRVWRNRECRRFFQSEHPISSVLETRAFVLCEDAPKIEDAHSLALKTGKTISYSARMKTDMAKSTLFNFAAKPIVCGKCEHKCSVILASAEPAVVLQIA